METPRTEAEHPSARQELPPAPSDIDAAHTLPPAGGPRPLRAGARGLARVLDRVGQEERADYLRDLDVDSVDARLGQGVRQIEERVRARPLITVGLALVAGFFAGRLLRD